MRARHGRRRRITVALVVVGALTGGLTAVPAAADAAQDRAHVTATAAPRAAATPKPTATASATTRARTAAKRATTPTASPTPTPTPTPTRAPRPVGHALSVEVVGTPVLTLPAGDHLRDTSRIRIRSGAKGTIDLIAIDGRKVVHLADALPLRRASLGWSRTVTVRIAQLARGSWTVRARRSDAGAVRARAAAPLLVGSGVPRHVLVHPSARTLYPYADGVLDAVETTVTATDETGAVLPVTGHLVLTSKRVDRTRTLSSTGATRMPVTGLPLGTAHLVTTVTGPAGTATRTTALTLAPTGAGTALLSRSADTVQPVVDGLLDTVALTTTGAAVAGSPAPVSGSLIITSGTNLVQRWRVPDGAARTFVWNGRINGAIVPGTYTATLSLHGPEGAARTVSKTLLVSKDHLPYRVQDLFTVASGNQQGLAVHDGVFYVGFDDGDGTARIDEYGPSGAALGSLGPLQIGHAAELSYSTTTNLLYAANGGPSTPTTVWALDPTTGAIQQTFDLSALGMSGMVAVDDANSRLLVFAGSAGAYTISSVSLVDKPADPADPASVDVPAGTVLGTTPIAVTGVPQGVEVVGGELWLYTSMKSRNRIARYDLTTDAAIASADLMNSGEGEGLAVVAGDPGDGLPAWIYVGTHTANRIGILQPVADE